MKFIKLETAEQVLDLIAFHNASSKFAALDLETTGLSPFTDTITAIVLSGKEPESACMFGAEFTHLLRQLINPTLILHNFRFDFNMLFRAGVDLRDRKYYDTMLLHHLFNENVRHGLDEIIQTRYKDNYKEVFWSAHDSFQAASEEDQLTYACKDVVYTERLYHELRAEIAAAGMPDSLVEHVHALARTLFNTEVNGLRLDLDYVMELGQMLKPQIEQYKVKMQAEVKHSAMSVELDQQAKMIRKLWSPRGQKWKEVQKPDFNWNSSDQLVSLLYEKLKLPVQLSKKRTPTVDDDALARIEALHPVVGMLREYREYQKAYTSFIEGTLEHMHAGRIHPKLNVNGTVTGRISSSDPNMQQLPAKGDWAKIRGIYLPDVGYNMLTCDYGQLEVCIAAHFSLDPNLLKIILEGASKHDITANALGIHRNVAKTLNFAMQYGCTAKKAADILGCGVKEAQKAWDKYWETYSGEKAVIDECKAKIDAGEPIVSPWGRQRRFPTKWEKPWHKESAYRAGYSALIQGTGSDCTSWAVYTVDDALRKANIGNVMFPVHDEIVVQYRQGAYAQAKDIVTSIMVKAGQQVNLRVPLSVECSDELTRWTK